MIVLEHSSYFTGILTMLLSNREDASLYRCEPDGENAIQMFNNHRKKSLNRTHNGGVNHHDALLFSFFIDAGEVKAFGHIHIQLDSGYLPVSSKIIFCHKI